MNAHKVLAVAVLAALILCLGAARQSKATVILERGRGVHNPAVETGGHRVSRGSRPPSVGIVLIDTSWFTPLSISPWSPFGALLLPPYDAFAKGTLGPRDGFRFNRPPRPVR